MSTNQLRNALKRAGFKVQTRQSPLNSPHKGSLWSITGHGVNKNHLTEAQAREILAAYRRGEYDE